MHDASTACMHDALRAYREDADIVATVDPWRAKLLTKEPQYFNRWPLPSSENYLHAWHSGVVGAMVSGAAGERVLLDASPQYLMTAAAPPRVKATVPHARFVFVVRVRSHFAECISGVDSFPRFSYLSVVRLFRVWLRFICGSPSLSHAAFSCI